MENRYRRKEDESSKLLVLLNERVSTLQKTLAKLTDRQSNNPCKTHGLRIKNLEKVMWVVLSAVLLLVGRLMYSLLVP